MIALLDINGAQSLFKGEYSSAFNKWQTGKRLYRNCYNSGNIFTAEPTPRVSSDTSNEYTLLISELLPSWSHFPKRNCCFIGSTVSSIADEYSGPQRCTYYAFLPNGSEIALCSNKDMWKSFPILENEIEISNINTFNKTLSSFLTGLLNIREATIMTMITEGEVSELFNRSKISEIECVFKKVSEILKTEPISNLTQIRINTIPSLAKEKFFNFFYNRITKNGKSFIDVLDELLSPSKNGFSRLNIENYNTDTPVEVWFEGKCLFVKAEKMVGL